MKILCGLVHANEGDIKLFGKHPNEDIYTFRRVGALIEDAGLYIALCFRNKVSKNISFDIDRLFDRFYKGDTSRNHIGSGLGLSIVKELCERMHIDIQASLQNDDLAITLSIPKSINHS